MLIQYVKYSRQFNAHTICVLQQAVKCWHNMCSAADSLMLTHFMLCSRLFNAHKVISIISNSVHILRSLVQFILAIYCFSVLTENAQDRRNMKYKQQPETHTQQIITNHTL